MHWSTKSRHNMASWCPYTTSRPLESRNQRNSFFDRIIPDINKLNEKQHKALWQSCVKNQIAGSMKSPNSYYWEKNIHFHWMTIYLSSVTKTPSRLHGRLHPPMHQCLKQTSSTWHRYSKDANTCSSSETPMNAQLANGGWLFQENMNMKPSTKLN